MCLKAGRLNLFWKLGFAFFALLIAVLLPVDFYAERALRRNYDRAGFEQLAAVARIALANPPQASSLSPSHPEDSVGLRCWVAKTPATGVTAPATFRCRFHGLFQGAWNVCRCFPAAGPRAIFVRLKRTALAIRWKLWRFP